MNNELVRYAGPTKDRSLTLPNMHIHVFYLIF